MNSKPNLSKSVILKTSAQLFRQESFAQVSMRDIANALNVKAASLYNHISSKDEILEELIFELVDMFMSKIEDTQKKTLNTKSKLEDIIQTHIEIALHRPNQYATLNNDWKYLKQKKRKYFIDQRQNYEKVLKQIIEKGIQNNNIKDCNPEIILYLMLSSLRTIHLWYEKKDIDTNTFKKEIPKLILEGIIK
ncbi:TetR/AcrR family transcriptional regulator [Mesohalobacter halotolerans]|uniref:TetR/AcrR family transcriptional regulator n=1 Tax=Mesohalobacter halotolerans TaxID=1883405 RepID=A0A4U5TR79_9FLAO|nr:TetR/AcrR family transcriptional regulator [Mesohalobacter halotolerans]MBS3739275.1 TetR/AcrR family transcriptional regulator [Psychroflexus sp.]TKS56281.1 TetR/AcrR family transcriptional regulator [Mesohalobacter halotolerans]